ncbi:heat shock protein HSP20 [Blastocystis sp. subtype 4]|uniref:heat shock protein HSP20 n=1 Tax=Blastocystis sp. subtype 4 TaxID=944170 RepID=UPI000711D12E|nr:heat shock protein HSP20 [Blastocystis sp. subtype 4]KNB44294.1 heat shock protein HSP20 [Blastocystis sp. subtype 4]|eukprot:XP_014527737.1 heat shock protein HSP20 [Blastocystis sp. subtype 4]
MSFILRDPFFNGFEDILSSNWPFGTRSYPFSLEDKTSDAISSPKRMRRDVITPFSGFGRMDLKETENNYELNVDIPGMNKSEIKITTDNNVLSIEGERKQEKTVDDKSNKYHFTERHFGSFHREISLPANANTEKIDAMYNNGVLMISIPKKEQATNKKHIDVKDVEDLNCCTDARVVQGVTLRP